MSLVNSPSRVVNTVEEFKKIVEELDKMGFKMAHVELSVSTDSDSSIPQVTISSTTRPTRT